MAALSFFVPNDYFQFQQFRIEQDACAMKVSTDACLLGAAVSLAGARRLLDVGTGTGLLALMAAQRYPAVAVEAIEIDAAAAGQAQANVAASPWASRVRVQHRALADYAATQPAPFDHIICNPPFFRHALPSQAAARRTARHADESSLTFAELIRFAAGFLTEAGQLTVLLPPPEMSQFQGEAANVGLHLMAELWVRHRPGAAVTRHVSTFGRSAERAVVRHEISIRDAAGSYSPAFRQLLGDFYLEFGPAAGR